MKLAEEIKKINAEIVKLSKQLGQTPPVFDEKDLKIAKTYVTGLRSDLNEMNSDLKYIADSFRDSVNELSKQNTYLSQSKSALKGISSVSLKLLEIKKGEVEADAKDIVKLQQKAKIRFEELQNALKYGNLKKAEKEEIQRSIKSQKEFLVGSEKVLEITKKINQNLGVKTFGGLKDITKAIPGLSRFSGDFETASDAAREMAHGIDSAANSGGKGLTHEKIKQLGLENELGKLAGTAAAQKLKGMSASKKGMLSLKAGAKSLVPLMKKAFPIFLLTEMIKALKLVDKEAGELAKDMGISYQEALRFSGEMNTVASLSGDIAVTQQGLMKSQKSLNEYFGQSAKFSGEIAKEFASIQKRTGLSDKAMGLFTQLAMEGGKDTKNILLNVNKTTLELNRQNKMSLSNKQVQEGIAKLSNSIRLSAEDNVEELTKAVFASKKLGASMAQIESIASNLLDFESSIQNELQAELLLGQDINLEKARQFALEGDMVGVSNEVLKNKAIMNAFDTKNVVAQEAAAKALGMSRDDLANMVVEQKNLATLQKAFDGKGVENMADAQAEYNKLRKEGMSAEEAGKKVGDESLANQLETISAAEKMENIMTRIQQLFMSLAEPILAIITPIIDILVPALQFVSELLSYIMVPVGWIVEGFKFLGDLATMFGEKIAEFTSGLGFAGTILRGLAYIMVLLAAFGAAWALSYIPVVGSILGAIAAATIIAKGFSAINSAPKKVGDAMGGANGKFEFSPEEGGLFEGSPGDQFVLAPGIADAAKASNKARMDQKGGGGAVAQDNDAMLTVMKGILAATQVVANKSTVLKVNEQVLADTTTQEQVKSDREMN